MIDDRRATVGGAHAEILILDNPARIVPSALNAALRRTRGEVIVRVDGHCAIATDYVRRCVTALYETGADCVGGLQRAAGEDHVGRAIALVTSSPFGVGSARFHYATNAGWVDTVYLGAYRRTVFERVGGFDEDLVRNQDDEFNFRLIQSGGTIWLDPAISSTYYGRASFRGLWRQYFQYGLYKVRVIQKRGAVPSWRHLVPATFVVGLVGSLILAVIARKPRVALSVAGPYVVANGVAALWTAQRAWWMSPLLSFAFLVLHLAYGTGFLWGLGYWSRKPLKHTVETTRR
jgi:hypothetical protein